MSSLFDIPGRVHSLGKSVREEVPNKGMILIISYFEKKVLLL